MLRAGRLSKNEANNGNASRPLNLARGCGIDHEDLIMKSAIVSLMRIVAGFTLVLTSHAAVEFTAGIGETRQPGDTFSLPISVAGFQNVDAFAFSLVWDSGVLTLKSPATVLNPGAQTAGWSELLNTTTLGTLGYSWDSTTLTSLADSSILLTVEFTVIGGSGNYPLTFADLPAARSVDQNFGTESIPLTHNGSLNVVPEPVNVALGLFGFVFMGTAAARWHAKHRKNPRPALNTERVLATVVRRYSTRTR